VGGGWISDRPCVGVWDTGTGALLCSLQGLPRDQAVLSLVTYERPSDGRPRIAAGFEAGLMRIYDGEDYSTLHAISTTPQHTAVSRLIAYEEPTSGRTRLVSELVVNENAPHQGARVCL
jgi:hypothetical protein